MPRQVRIQHPGAIYHVMSRGNRRQDIFLDEVVRQDFLKTLAEACQKSDRLAGARHTHHENAFFRCRGKFLSGFLVRRLL